MNLQPWCFVVVDSDEGKAKLRPLVRWNTIQNDTSSAMVLLFGDLQCYEYGELAETFGLDKERYVPVLILSIGKAAETVEETVRLDAERFTTFK